LLLEVEIAVEKMKSHKSPSTDQISAELIQTGGNVLRSEILRFVNCILPEQWMRSVIVPTFRNGNKTYGNNYRISLLSTTFKLLFDILLLKITPYVDEIIGDYQCGF
jgi:hypothetical protein